MLEYPLKSLLSLNIGLSKAENMGKTNVIIIDFHCNLMVNGIGAHADTKSMAYMTLPWFQF